MRLPRFVRSFARCASPRSATVLFALLLLLGPARADTRERPLNILMVSSWHKDMPVQHAFDAGLQAGLREAGRRYDLFVEYLDAGRFDARSQRDLILFTLRQKFKAKKFDVIVAESAPAVQLLVDNPDLFPGARRIYVPTGTLIDARDTGETITVTADFERAIAEMVRLVEPRKIYVLAEPSNGPGGSAVLQRVKEAVALAASSIETEYLVDLSVAEIGKRVSALPRHSAIFMLPIFNSQGKTRYPPRRSAELIAEKANAPIFTVWQSMIGTGVLGGYALSTERIGRITAQRILGVDAKALISASALYYDWRQLERFGISESRVPAGATLLFREPSVFESYRWQIATTSGIVALLAILSTFLLLNVIRRRHAEQALIRANEHLEDKVRERTRELSEANERAIEASQAKSDFLSNMSHEIRTPLNAVIGFSEFVLEELEEAGDEDLSNDVHRILDSGRHLLSLVNDILDLSKIEAGKMELFADDIVLSELIGEVTATSQSLMEKNGNRLVVEIAPEVPVVVRNDPVRVKQILFNLLSNAAKFTRQGTVKLSVAMGTEAGIPVMRLAVADTGIGMSPDQLERLFQDFSQVNSSLTREFEGTGLGLSICRRLTDMMGGRIEAASALGEGATFTVTVPAAVGEAVESVARMPVAAAENDRAGGCMVLVVDDDASARAILARYLMQSGFQVAVASSGAEGLERARALRPDAITLDVVMEDKVGWDVLTELKSDPETMGIPVIMCSFLDDERRAATLGAVAHLVKPVSRDRLTSVIARHIKRSTGDYILVVDDEEYWRNLLSMASRRQDVDVAVAADGREALGIMEARGTPVCVVLGLDMPVMDGFKFLHQIRSIEEYRNVPLVTVTGTALSTRESAFLTAASTHVFQKDGGDLGFTLDGINKALQEVCASNSGERGREPALN